MVAVIAELIWVQHVFLLLQEEPKMYFPAAAAVQPPGKSFPHAVGVNGASRLILCDTALLARAADESNQL